MYLVLAILVLFIYFTSVNVNLVEEIIMYHKNKIYNFFPHMVGAKC